MATKIFRLKIEKEEENDKKKTFDNLINKLVKL